MEKAENFIYLKGAKKTLFSRQIVKIEWDHKEPEEVAVVTMTVGHYLIIKDPADLKLLAKLYKN